MKFGQVWMSATRVEPRGFTNLPASTHQDEATESSNAAWITREAAPARMRMELLEVLMRVGSRVFPYPHTKRSKRWGHTGWSNAGSPTRSHDGEASTTIRCGLSDAGSSRLFLPESRLILSRI